MLTFCGGEDVVNGERCRRQLGPVSAGVRVVGF